MRLLRLAAGLLVLCLLQSCGGGGGDDDDGGQARFTISLNRSSIAFEMFEGGPTPTQTILASTSGDYDGTLFVGATVEGQGIDPTIQILVNGTSGTIFVNPAGGLAVGTYTGRVIFHACSDQACATHIGGTPIAVSYTVTVKRRTRLEPTSLDFQQQSGTGTSGEVNVQFPDGVSSYTLSVPQTQLDWLSVSSQGAASFTVAARSMPVGTYSAAIAVTSGGSLAALPVTYTVSAPPGGAHGIIIVNPDILSMSTNEGLEFSDTLLVTPPTWNPSALTASVEYNGAPPSSWLTVTPTTGGFAVTASAAALPQGTYDASIFIDTVPMHESISVTALLHVGPGLVAPPTQVITVDSDTTHAQLSGSVRIDNAGGPPVDWTASTTAPWLTLTRAAGETGTDIEYTVDTATVNGWDNFSDHVATIDVASTASSISAIDFDVDVRLRMAEVTGVGPHLLIEGQSSNVIVRGRGFAELAAPLARLRFGNAAAFDAVLINDTELAVDAGALALGPHTVRVSNALNRTLQSRDVRVIAAESYAYKAFALTWERAEGGLVYDAERQSAYASSSVPQNMYRFPVVSASTVAELISQPGGFQIGFTADGAQFVTGGQTEIALLDRDTLAVVPGSQFSTFETFNPTVYGSYPRGDQGLMVSNDSRLWYTGYDSLHLHNKATRRITLAQATPSGVLATPRAMSRNGERIVGVDSNISAGFETYALVYADARDSVLHHRGDPISIFPHIMLSDDGQRVLAGYSTVLGGGLDTVGDVVLPASGSDYDPITAAISPDGTRVYVLTYERSDYNNFTPSHVPRVYVFDSSTPVTAPQTLPVLGYFEFDDYPTCMHSSCSSPTLANITPDGGALLIVSNRNFVVVPTDTALVSATAPGGTQKMQRPSSMKTVPWKLRSSR